MKEVEVIKASTGSIARRRSISGEGVKLERNRVAAYARVSTDEENSLEVFSRRFNITKIKSSKIKSGFLLVFTLMRQLLVRSQIREMVFSR